MWWAMATMSTVGYGDVFPVTLPGKFIGIMTMLTGILLIALPVAIVGGEFQVVIQDSNKKERVIKFSIGF